MGATIASDNHGIDMTLNPPSPWGRYRGLLIIAGLMLSISLLTRAGLLWYEGTASHFEAASLVKIFSVGFVYDVAALSWILIPFSTLAFVCSRGNWGRRIYAVLGSGLLLAFTVALFFNATSEFIFWNEFTSRFNFIAVDYLVYTREVVGNIQQSYPLGKILLAISLISVVTYALVARRFWQLASGPAPRLRVRFLVWLGLGLIPAAVFFGLDESLHKPMTPSARELSSNGTYALFRAYRNNELDYRKYYKTLPHEDVSKTLTEELLEAHASASSYQPAEDTPMRRHIAAAGPVVRKNVVLVSIESLGSDYVGAFGSQKGLTPHLDALAAESLTFQNVYATGLRTVRGLEALTLSVPPTPGRAVPMRERNRGLQTLGGVFKDQGYEPLYIYGGYSVFDNMRDFFGGNGYTVIDRTAIPDDQISHETIWGVADEDLYKLAIRELDKRASAKQLFFAHIMTTSNHRPYTYPDNRVAIPSHTGRDGAVQYTDWAIGQFIEEAKTRPWFNNTLFVFVADHTSHGRGRIDLPPENYRIPVLVYAPGFIQPRQVNNVASQIDVAPTLLSLLNIAYESDFFGQDMLHEASYHPRAFMANYLTVGYMEDNKIVELGPREYVRVVDAKHGHTLSAESDQTVRHLAHEAISYYQAAATYLTAHALSEAEVANKTLR